jgi:N-dimethylarginine dimethylaminohydrolase
MSVSLPLERWGVGSETGRLTDILLCRPVHYEWMPINAKAKATMAAQRRFDREGMLAQFDEMVGALGEASVACHFLAPDPALKYQVFTRDSSQMTPDGVAMMLMHRPERRGEYAAILDFYAAAGIPVCFKATAGSLEAGDIHLIRPGLAVIGYSDVRTEHAGASQFATYLRKRGWDVRVQYFPELFLHFDVLFCMVADGLAVACRSVLDDDFLDWLRERQIRIIDVGYRETIQLGCNLVALGDNRVLSMAENKTVNAALRAEGLTVFDPHLDLLYAGGGSVHCLTMPLNRVGV